MAYLFPNDRYNVSVFLLLAQPADTLFLKMKILYWIEYKHLLEVYGDFSRQHEGRQLIN